MARAAAKVESLKEYDVVKDSAHVGAVMAYTDETDLYTQLIAMACVVVAYTVMAYVVVVCVVMAHEESVMAYTDKTDL